MLLKEDPSYFESTMAMRLAFGILTKWAKKFRCVECSAPTWYYSFYRYDCDSMNQFFNPSIIRSSPPQATMAEFSFQFWRFGWREGHPAVDLAVAVAKLVRSSNRKPKLPIL